MKYLAVVLFGFAGAIYAYQGEWLAVIVVLYALSTIMFQEVSEHLIEMQEKVIKAQEHIIEDLSNAYK